MRKLLLIIILIALLPLEAAAQRRYRYAGKAATEAQRIAAIERRYTESIDSLHESIYADSISSGSYDFSGKERLFMPLTFYKDITGRLFSPSATTTPADTLLMHQYLVSPSLTGLLNEASSNKESEEVEAPIHHRVKIAEKVDDSQEMPTVDIPHYIYISKPSFWTFSGDYSLQFLQNYVSSNWYKGGESNYSMLGAVTMQANFNNKQKLKWENKLELKYGLQTSRGDTLHSFKQTQDLMRLTSKLGLQATKKWYYTLQMVAYTQFARQYKTNNPKVYSDFMSPFNINFSLGMDYNVEWLKKKLKGSIHLAPLAYNLRYVGRLDLSKTYGLEEGKHTLNDFGSELTVDLTWTFTDMIKWQTRLYGYTTYKRSEVEWENTLSFQFNRWISSQLFVYPRFDDGGEADNHHGYLQLKEYLSLGFTYSF